MADSFELSEQSGQVLSSAERARVLSATRLKLALTLFAVAVVLGLSAMMFGGVSRIFGWLTPTIRADLEHKARRGALDLAESAQLGIVARERAEIARAARDYSLDGDVVGIVAADADGDAVFEHGAEAHAARKVFAGAPNVALDFGDQYGAWAPSLIEGVSVGRVALLVSKDRLRAGLELRQQILLVAAVGCLVALGLCLLFVNTYIGPLLKVTEQAFTRLEHTTEAALAAARLKSQFLANMSHEIRTPMNGIIGVLDLIGRTELNAKQQRYVQIIESSARGLLTIINDVLDFSKLEAGKYELRADEFELHQINEEVAELLSPKAHDKGLELITRTDPDVPSVIVGDTDRIKQVLGNLIGNAIKFTERGQVELRVSVEQRTAEGLLLRFAVTDSGTGIDPRDQSRLFAVFTQLDGTLTRKHGGTGLGLAISKQLVEAMGGTIGVHSELGRGSTFWFTLSTRAGQTAVPPREKQPANVLLVCPNAAQRDAVRAQLEPWGIQCEHAAGVPEAVDLVLAREGGFDVVVLDGALEGPSTDPSALLELCLGEALPVIHMLSTAQVASGRADETQNNYLLKPLRASELYNGLLNVLRGGSVQSPRAHAQRIPRNSLVPRQSRVLVVDDNEINRVVAVDLLNELGYDADTACNGVEAVSKAKLGGYAVILMDCQMPELDGFEATRQIRALAEPACKVPIIALTAHALTGDRDRVLSGGMDDYTTKPIRARTLEQLLRRWEKAGLERGTIPAPANDNAGALQVHTCAPADPLAPPRLDGLPMLDPSLPRSQLVVELFLRTVPSLIEALEQAVSSQDTTEVNRLAHKLKGNCLSLGANTLAAVFHAIEAAAAAQQLHHDALQLVPRFYAELAGELDPSHGSARPTRASGTHHG